MATFIGRPNQQPFDAFKELQNINQRGFNQRLALQQANNQAQARQALALQGIASRKDLQNTLLTSNISENALNRKSRESIANTASKTGAARQAVLDRQRQAELAAKLANKTVTKTGTSDKGERTDITTTGVDPLNVQNIIRQFQGLAPIETKSVSTPANVPINTGKIHKETGKEIWTFNGKEMLKN